ncbi:SAP domain-containing ribonucleoprotein-like isoform X2 [Pollicipes pollicipes]|nr:SAP domain-containing ribonucleoprotein-like isoform X2 [Pollicipes pollicipes]
MNVAKLKIAELKKELKERGLPTSGNKSELASRLKDALLAEGADSSHQEEDLDAKESELLGEEEDEDSNSPAELDTKLLETATPAAKPRKIVINREAAASAQQAAATAIAQATKAAPPAAATAAAAAADAPASKRIKLTTSGLSEMERLAKRSEKLGGAKPTVSALKVLTPEERKAARLAKFGAPQQADAGGQKNGSGASELDKLKKRAGRFGEAVSEKVISLEESERLKRRKERFGIVVPEDVKAKRAARFASSAPLDPASEDKKRLRAARFGMA